MLFIKLRSGRIIQDHVRSHSAAIDRLINYDFVYAEWCGCEIKWVNM
jgi:hypothetical protein